MYIYSDLEEHSKESRLNESRAEEYRSKTDFSPEQVLSDCTLCPRNCHVNRLRGERGFCGETGSLRAARAALYYNEEPVISGRRGSGTVFFTGCNLGCVYCQNRQISRPAVPGPAVPVRTGADGAEIPSAGSAAEGVIPASEHALPAADRVPPTADHALPAADRVPPTADHALPAAERVPLSPERLAEIFFELEAQGAHNINLVTPEHFVPLLIPALREAKMNGLSIPVVYNTGSYEKVEAVRALEGLVDIWLPDLKYMSPALAASHTGAPDYFRHASAAIAEMVRQCPEPVFSDGSHAIDCADDADDPLMTRGVLVRHLALPGCAEDSRAILRYLRETYGNRIFISLLNQYTPMPKAPGSLARRLSESEYDALVSYAIEIGIENGFVQESGTVSSSYIPVFDGTGI